MKKLISIAGVLLALELVFGLMAALLPETQITAKAAVQKTFNLGDRVTIDDVPGREWYVVKQDSTSVTLLSTKCFKDCRYGVTSNYDSSMVKKELRSLISGSGELANIKTVLCDEPRLLTANEVEYIKPRRKNVLKCGHDHYWWTQTPSGAKNQHVRNITVRCVQGEFAWIQTGEAGKPTMSTYGMRPAIQLDLSKVNYDDERKAFFIIPDPPDPVEAPKAVITKYPTYHNEKCILIAKTTNGVYDNQDLLTRDGEVENGVMVYTLTTDEPTLEELDSLADDAWTTDFPQGNEPKTYYVCFKARGTRNDVSYFDDSPAEFFIVKIITPEEAMKASVTEWPEAKFGLIANGKAQDIVTPGTAEHGEMLYALGKNSDTPPDAGAFSPSIPKGRNAGFYYVWFMAKSNETEYVDSEPACVVNEIITPEEAEREKRAKVIEGPKPKSNLIANGRPQELVTPGKGTQGIMVYALGKNAVTAPSAQAFSESIPKGTGAGIYYVWYKQKGDDGFEDTDPLCVVVVISGSEEASTSVPEPEGFNTCIRIKQSDGKLSVSWDKVDGVKKVKVYITYSGKKFASKADKTTNKNSVTIKKIKGKKLDQKKNFKLYLVGYDVTGKEIGKTPTAYFAGKDNKKYTNVKSIKLSKSSVSIAKGHSTRIKVTTKLADRKKKQFIEGHAAKIRYRSTIPGIATVDEKGKITGISTGVCHVYVYAQNGLSKKVKVTVTE